MKVISTIFTILLVLLGLGLKLMRFQRITNGENVSAYDIGYEAGSSFASGDSPFSSRKSTEPAAPPEVRTNPFVD